MISYALRLFIDECISPSIITAYINPHLEVTGESAEVKHYKDLFGGNGKLKDKDFIPLLAKSPTPRWIVISGDRSKTSSYVDSMELACFQNGITLICFSQKARARGAGYVGPQLTANWDSIQKASRGPHGAQYLIRGHHSTWEHTVFQATKCPSGYTLKNGVCIKD